MCIRDRASVARCELALQHPIQVICVRDLGSFWVWKQLPNDGGWTKTWQMPTTLHGLNDRSSHAAIPHSGHLSQEPVTGGWPAEAVDFHSENLQKSLLFPSSVQAVLSSSSTFPEKLCCTLKTPNLGPHKPQGIFCHLKKMVSHGNLNTTQIAWDISYTVTRI